MTKKNTGDSRSNGIVWHFKLRQLVVICSQIAALLFLSFPKTTLSQDIPPTSTRPKSSTPLDGDAVLRALQERTTATIEQARGGVVAIARVERLPEPRQQALQFRLGLPQGLAKFAAPDSPDFNPQGFGAGIVWDDSGTVVTAYHVLGDPRSNDYYVWVDGRPLPAKALPVKGEVKAGDPYSDIAVLKVDPIGLLPIQRVVDSSLKKGQVVIHLGNPYGIAKDGRMSAGWGMVANIQRSPIDTETEEASNEKESLAQFGTLIQLDSRLPIGCSGGALLNLDGQLIGMTVSNAAINHGESSIGFAIPLDQTFVRVVETLKEGKLPAFGFLGIQPEDLSPEERRSGRSGVRVVAVVRGMPGDLAGIREDDRLLEVDDRAVESRSGLFRELSRKGADEEVRIKVQRFESNRSKDLILKARLSKKFVATHRPSYAIHEDPTWRGLQVEYATALPPEMIRFPVRNGTTTNGTSLACLNVIPDSPAWKAGIRSGATIVSIAGTPVSSPAEFAKKVSEWEGRSVRIKIVSHGDKLQDVEVAVPELLERN